MGEYKQQINKEIKQNKKKQTDKNIVWIVKEYFLNMSNIHIPRT